MEFIAPQPPQPTASYADCVVATPPGYRPLRLDLHLPEGPGPFPAVLWIHGGGWLEGRRGGVPETIAPHGLHDRLISRGYAVADVEYRLSLEAPYPAQLSDVRAAIRWLRHFADTLRVDSGRFATFGESAGGHLALMAGLLGSDETAIQSVVDWYGVSDLDFRDARDPYTPDAILLGGPIEERREFARWASPRYQVRSGAPPVLAVHGTADTIVPIWQSERLVEALRGYGVRADLHRVPDAGHCFVGCPDIGALIDLSIDFLDDTLKGAAG